MRAVVAVLVAAGVVAGCAPRLTPETFLLYGRANRLYGAVEGPLTEACSRGRLPERTCLDLAAGRAVLADADREVRRQATETGTVEWGKVAAYLDAVLALAARLGVLGVAVP